MAKYPDVTVEGLAVMKIARSGQPDELLDRFQINSRSIIEKVKSMKT